MDFSLSDSFMLFFTCIIAIFTGLLWRVGTQQNRDTRILQRAYLAVEPLGIEPFCEKAWAHISVRNRGKLPARDVIWFITHTISSNGKLKQFDINENRFYGEGFVIPAESEMKRSHRCKFDESEIHSFHSAPEDNRVFLFVWGEIRYIDGFGERRFTRFCHRYDKFGLRKISDGPHTGKDMLIAESMRYHQYGNEAD